mmetsp:Transcript_17367/g.47413  ORF Transcript_17367/g.47413 Transcript_17367/m.47413 type:complete len:312 (-) Transcript_17367:281-1216(-)|eukprot:CAMPEP_0168732110 /NCGR_PEP_ID=MMETSP0724-20121128/7606_1 /TAXON_ID=265536 /ORGANISM="Amphiprora sp., Strain CCMP467" /LENGTH=311 /DNA_ID=CAMNT_0008779127 /DNA_START=53 /DNA_END=988 /DNA_ORIENTATION=+
MTDLQVEMNYDYATAERFPAWISLAVFSAICMAAFCSEVNSEYRGSDEKWVLAVYCISMSVATLASVAYLMVRSIFSGTIIEITMVTLVTAFWGIGLPVMMKPDNAIAVVGPDVNNANLYFFSWIAFIVAIFLVLSLVREKLAFDVRDTPGKQLKWFFLAASSLVVMGSAVRIHKSASVACGDDGSALSGSDYCKRTNFAISLGVVTFFVALTVLFMIMKSIMATMIELGLTTILLILWTFGVGFITFGGRERAPGTTIGNLYFSTWISFMLCLFLFGNSLQEFTAGGAAQETPSTSPPDENGETGALPEE